MLNLKKISKEFNNNIVLSDICLVVNNQELIHIKGKNGSGKSTLLKIIASLMKPDSGSVEITKNTKIGGLIENPSFIEDESLLYNLKFLYNLTGNFDESKVKRLTDQFGLDLYSKKKIKKYSVGMRQKAGIIQSIMEDQNLILLDEPTRGLDDESIQVFNTVIKGLINQGKSIIICAHDGVNDIEFTKKMELKNAKLYTLE